MRVAWPPSLRQVGAQDVHTRGRDVDGVRPVVRERGQVAVLVDGGDDEHVRGVVGRRIGGHDVVVHAVVARRVHEHDALPVGVEDRVGEGLVGHARAPARVDDACAVIGGEVHGRHGGGERARARGVEDLQGHDLGMPVDARRHPCRCFRSRR